MSKSESNPNISVTTLWDAIKKEYENVAVDPNKGYHFHTGREAANRIGYDKTFFDNVPEDNIASFAGTGNPFNLGPINPDDIVIDVGSGSGFDSLVASRLVGPKGRVIGIDMTFAMLEKARKGAEEMGVTHVEFREGKAEDLPLPDDFADVVISNGVLNLTMDKRKTLKEWKRVLKPGGSLYIGDILVTKSVPQSALDDISLWTGWIAGGLPEAELLKAMNDAGFIEAEIVQKHNIFEGVPNPSSALEFGTVGISLRAQKPK